MRGLLDVIACVQVKQSTVHGQGVFAKVDICQGTVLGVYSGVHPSCDALLPEHSSSVMFTCLTVEQD